MKPLGKLLCELTRAAIHRALKRPAPDRIPLTGDAVGHRDYFVIRLFDPHSDAKFLVQQLNQGGLSGLYFEEGNSEGLALSIPNEAIAGYKFRITHYFKEFEVVYSTPHEFLIEQVSGYWRLRAFCERLLRDRYNRKRLVRQDRMKVLRLVFDNTIRDHDFKVSGWGLMDLLYEPRWSGHPDNFNLLQYYETVLRSLKGGGDLTEEAGTFRLAPQALQTLSVFDEDERRHADQVRMQRRIAWLTFWLVMIGLLQAYVTWSK